MGYEVLSRRDSGSEKCPKCCRVNVDFLILWGGLLGCFDCGTVFVRKSMRVKGVDRPEVPVPGMFVDAVVDRLKASIAESVPVTPMEVGIPGREEDLFKGVVTPAMKGVEKNTPTATTIYGFTCDICGKICKNALGLNAHKRSHK